MPGLYLLSNHAPVGTKGTPPRDGEGCHLPAVVTFTPGAVHRLVDADGRLRIVVAMQNSGLPEAGDAVFTSPPEILRDPGRYGQAATVTDAEGARRRRDLAIEGFLRLRDGESLEDFHRAAGRDGGRRRAAGQPTWTTGRRPASGSAWRSTSRVRGGMSPPPKTR